jgi:4,5-DOPA dioxygenase extradiol
MDMAAASLVAASRRVASRRPIVQPSQQCVSRRLSLKMARSAHTYGLSERAKLSAMNALPSLYISHGSPMTALDPGKVGERLAAARFGIAQAQGHRHCHGTLARAFAHGRRRGASGNHPRFYGFPRELFDIRYPAPGAPAVAAQVMDLLDRAGLAPTLDTAHGLDHGAWVPLRLIHPQADIPVVPLSIQPHLGPAHHYAIGQALAPLREQGVLVIGSGSITHNLHDFRAGYSEEREAPYVRPFIEWIEQKLTNGDVDALLDYRSQAPYAERAHPTDEHLLPFYVALGCGRQTPEGSAHRRRRRSWLPCHGYLSLRRAKSRRHCTMMVPTIIGMDRAVIGIGSRLLKT